MNESTVIVLDASAAIAVVRKESNRGIALGELERLADDGGRLVVPPHFWLELMSSLVMRHRMLGADVLQAIHEFDKWGIETIETDRATVISTLDLVERFGLTPLDAMYLAVAISLDGQLLTFDRELRAAAGPRLVGAGRFRLSDAPAPYERDVSWPHYKEASAFLAHLRAEALIGRP